MNCIWKMALIAALLAVSGTSYSDEGDARDVSVPRCSPDGSKIVFATNALSTSSIDDIWRVNLDGSWLTQLTSTSDIDEGNPVYSPDGAHIAYSRCATNEKSVYVMSSDGSSPYRLNRVGNPAFSAAAWLSDSQRLVIDNSGASSSDLMLTDISGAEIKLLAASPGNESSPHCSSDDIWMVYECQPSSCSSCSEQGKICSQIWKRNISTMDPAVQLTTGHYQDSHPRISPDNSKIVFESDRDSANGHFSSAYTMNADGTGLTRINVPANAYDPAWTPDGRIVFVLGETDSNAFGEALNIALVMPDGTGLTRITQTVVSPNMMPDGGSFGSFPQTVEMTCSMAGSTIRYTTDGSTPSESSSAYVGPITLNDPAVIRAKAWKSGCLPSLITGREFELAP